MATTIKRLSRHATDLMPCGRGRFHSEVQLRTVIGRAYYAAFLAVRDFLDLTNVSSGVHRLVKDKISDYPGLGKAISDKLSVLFGLRTKADYKLRDNVTWLEAKRSLRLMREILKLLGRLKARKNANILPGNGSQGKAVRIKRKTKRKRAGLAH